MQISGSIPFHVAQAYGVGRPAPAHTPAATTATSPLGRIAPSAQVRTVDATADLTTVSGVKRSPGLDKLVGATVHRPISFDGAATATPNAAGSLPLYTRAADKIEAAVAVNLGRAIDIRG